MGGTKQKQVKKVKQNGGVNSPEKPTLLRQHERALQLKKDSELIGFIKRLVCNYYKETEEDVNSKVRLRELVMVRYISMYLIAKNCKATTLKIGKSFGGRSHCTTLYAKRTIAGFLTWDKALMADVKELQLKIDGHIRSTEMLVHGGGTVIDLNNFVECKLGNNKTILLVGLDEKEVQKFIEHNKIIPTLTQRHEKTGLYFLNKTNEVETEHNNNKGLLHNT